MLLGDRVRLVWHLVLASGFVDTINIFPHKKEVGSDGCSARRLDAVKKAAEHFLVLIIAHAGPFLAVSPLAAVHRSVGIGR